MPYGRSGWRREDGATGVEYAVMTALTGLVVMMHVSALATNLQTVLPGVDSALDGGDVETLPPLRLQNS